ARTPRDRARRGAEQTRRLDVLQRRTTKLTDDAERARKLASLQKLRQRLAAPAGARRAAKALATRLAEPGPTSRASSTAFRCCNATAARGSPALRTRDP